METPPSNWIDNATLIVGVLTLILAIIVLIVNNRNAIRNRKVHVADKRQEWVNAFRNQIAEILSVQKRILQQFDAYSYEQLQDVLKRLSTLTNQVKFMFDKDDINRNKLENSFDSVFAGLKDLEKDRVVEEQKNIISATDLIIREQRKKITDLDSSDPLI